MRVNLNELIVHRNETFTLDRYIVNKDGTPYILSKEVANQWILVTVASSLYGQAGRYKNNWWLDLSEYPKFTETTPIPLDDLVTTRGGTTKAYPAGYPAGQVSAWLGDKQIADNDYHPYVFSHKVNEDTIQYRYWNGSAYVPYEFSFELVFTQEETREMVESEYLYSIFLVAGETVHDTLHTLCQEHNIDDLTMRDIERYNALEEKGVWKGRDFSLTAPIGTFSLMLPFLTPTKMSVISNLEGAM